MQWQKLYFTVHAIARMAERKISAEDVEMSLKSGEIIQSYPDDKPFPSHLILGVPNGRSMHLVVSENQKDQTVIVITAYEPDANEWEPGFRRRK